MEYFFSFGLYFLSSMVVFGIFLALYAKVTPYDDYAMIFKEGNIASALGFGGAVVGLSIPLYSALSHSISYDDFLIWAMVAMLIQLLFAFLLTRLGTSVKQHIEEGNIAVGLFMACMSISIGLINAGSMSY